MACSTFGDLKARVLPAFFLTLIGFACLLASKWSFAAIATLALAVMTYEIFFDTPNKFLTLKIFTFLICICGISSLVFFRALCGAGVCIFLICAASGTDMGGYFFGKLIGGPKLCPRISPNKTISGFVGAILFANILCFICAKCFSFSVNLYVTQFIILFAILGDLFESKVKRIFGIKDFGTCLKGHGGVLDRFDSLVFSSIAFAIFYLI